MKGSPIKAAGQQQNVVRSRFFIRVSRVCLSDVLQTGFGPVISSFDFGPGLRRDDPFSHPSGSSADAANHSHFEPKGAGRSLCPCSLRLVSLGSFVLRTLTLLVKPLCCTQLQICRSPENLQCRTVFIQFHANCGWPRLGVVSNPLLTHSTVESSAK